MLPVWTLSSLWRLAPCVAALLLPWMGCAYSLSVTPQQQAAEQERLSCGSGARKLDPSLLAPDLIQRVEPLRHRTDTKRGPEYRLVGAKLSCQARPGVTAEWLERNLRCHSARRTLSPELEAASDPYWLPSGWVDIEVKSSGYGFQVALRSEDPEAASQILARATSYIGR